MSDLGAKQSTLPVGFFHGYASASYQIEGALTEDGRGQSQWDILLTGKDTGRDACDSYHKWEDDIKLLQQYGANSYRFSIAWPRIIPKGGRNDPVNPLGIQYYNKLIDGLVAAKITPFVTLFHWDLPLELENRYGGFVVSEKHAEELFLDFENYARVCFEAFGDRVKHWITLNEPQVYSWLIATFLRKDFDMIIDRWRLARNLILAHARVVKLYRNQYKTQQKGVIGITLNIEWVKGWDESKPAQAAAQRSLSVMAGLYADPIYKGHRNTIATNLSNGALKDYSAAEWKVVAGSSDFFGLNHYSTRYTTGRLLDEVSIFDAHFGGVENVFEDKNGNPIGHRGNNGHPYTVPWGFHELLHYIHNTWGKAKENCTGQAIDIIVTENGYAGQDEGEFPLSDIVNDVHRQDYYTGYIDSMVRAFEEGVPVRGYLAWSLLDNLEWNAGYGPRFGVTHVDRANDFIRTPKDSAKLIKEIFDRLCPGGAEAAKSVNA